MKKFLSVLIFLIVVYRCVSSSIEEEEFGGFSVECLCNLTRSSLICEVQNVKLVTSNDNREIISIKGLNSYDDVDGFFASMVTVKFFPRGLTKFFTNLKFITIINAELEEVTSEDLKEFGEKLQILRLSSNKIQRIHADLFEFNPNLEKINLAHNKIIQIDDGAFNGLKKLKILDLRYNLCTSSTYKAIDHSEVLELASIVESKCKSSSGINVECLFVRIINEKVCYVQNSQLITSKDNREVSSIGYEDDNWKSYSEVTKFVAENITIKFFPRKLSKFFRNIKKVKVVNAGLEEVTKEDLKGFGERLKVLILLDNKINKIDEDLFEFNPNLEEINLSRNHIKMIGGGTFKGLMKLKRLDLSFNPCTNSNDKATDGSNAHKLIEKIKDACKIFHNL